MDSLHSDTVTFAYVHFKEKPSKDELLRLEVWLKTRTKADSLKLVVD
jgi:hypothetical protein